MKPVTPFLGLVVLFLTSGAAAQNGSPAPSLLEASFSRLPIYFIENRGVYPDGVAYYVRGADKTLFFTRDGITFRLTGKERGWVVKLEFVGASRDACPEGRDRQQAVLSYFTGPEKDWKTGLSTYSQVVYEDLWPGIDLVYQGTVHRLKYEFVVKPGAHPEQIRLEYRGATEVTVTDAGGLRVETPAGSFEDAPPVAWQDVDGKRVPVESAFRLPDRSGDGACGFGFRVGVHDRTRPLILDPALLVYCGYIGGAGSEWGHCGIAVDAAGSAYVTGNTNADEKTFPVKVGPDLTYNGGDRNGGSYGDAFVAKVNPQGTGLIYCGYIGGASWDYGSGIAVDAGGNAYVTGLTTSDEKTFPVKGGPDLTFNGSGSTDAFVAKVNARGTALVYCGYIGGSGGDDGTDIAVDAAGNAYVTGSTTSTQQTFPVKVGPNLTNGGTWGDAFVAKVNAQGTALDYCGYIGGAFRDSGTGIAVDAAGNAYVTGNTTSTQQTFPVTAGPDLTYNGGTYGDAFVAKVNARGTGLVYCGYIGGSNDDFGNDIAVDQAGNAYVAGGTRSDEKTFPVKNGPDLSLNGPGDPFVAKVNAPGTGLVYCGYIGGAYGGQADGIAVDSAGNAYVSGNTASNEKTFPVKGGPILTHSGNSDAFVAKVHASGKSLVYCGYIGGWSVDYGHDIAVDAAGNAYVAGVTQSEEQTFPVKVGPDLTYNGGKPQSTPCDTYVAKIALTHLEDSGSSRPGGIVSLLLTASDGGGVPYFVGTSLGTGPIPIDTRQLNLSPDNLLFVTVSNRCPGIFAGYQGMIDAKGRAQAAIHIPDVPALIGVRLHTAFVTVDPASPSGIRSISNTISFSITKYG